MPLTSTLRRVRILPYKWCSLSAAALSKALNTKCISVTKQEFDPRKKYSIVNWGNTSEYAEWLESRSKIFLNSTSAVRQAVNKLEFYELCKRESLPGPQWTRDIATASEWAKNHIVLARTLVEASGGKGITLVEPGQSVPSAKVYTLYAPKRAEYRVHIFRGNVIDIQQKKLRNGLETKNYQVRSHDNGWVFCRENISVPEEVSKCALKALEASRLDFGAVDVGWNEKKQKATIYEINTAPGLEGTTLELYTTHIRNYFNL